MGKKLRFRGAKNGKVGVLEAKFHFFQIWWIFQNFWPKSARILPRRLNGSSFDKFYNALRPLTDLVA